MQNLSSTNSNSKPLVSSKSALTPSSYVCSPKFEKDPKQKEIIYLDEGYHLVLAPPGCGKTDLLAERVVRALSRGIPAEKMLCLTFTNRAARGMRNRIAERLQIDSPEFFIGNIHRFCAHFLFDNDIVSKNASIMDENESVSILQSLIGIEETPVDVSCRNPLQTIITLQHLAYEISHKLPSEIWKTSRAYADLFEPIKKLMQDNNLETNTAAFANLYEGISAQQDLCKEFHRGVGVTPEYLSNIDIGDNRTIKFILENLLHYPLYCLQLAWDYQQYKLEHNLLDFEDLLMLAYEYAYYHPHDIARYSWVQIDEVQDINPLQFAIIDLFTEQQNVTLYLGDEQQAIFSFIGAQLSTLAWLKQRCTGHIHTMVNNYRSPQYLLDVFNTYAYHELQVDPALLPHSNHSEAPDQFALQIIKGQDQDHEAKVIVNLIQRFLHDYPQERVAVLVPWNKHADLVSEQLENAQLPHFKISGTDLFTRPTTELLFAHLQCVCYKNNILAWTKLLHGIKIFSKPSYARRFVKNLNDNYVMPSDLIEYPQSSYLLELEKCCNGTYVIFDTETTGLDVQHDDIVQIAALKIRAGTVIDKFNILLETSLTIPPTLNNEINPLVEVYATQPHLPRHQGLQSFLDFVQDCPVIGHNVAFDCQILKFNLEHEGIYQPLPTFFDTLTTTRLLQPRLRQYKLKFLIEAFSLQGKNSHLADDDIAATFELLKYLLNFFAQHKSKHLECLQNNTAEAMLINQNYGPIYLQAKSHLFLTPDQYADLLAGDVLEAADANSDFMTNAVTITNTANNADTMTNTDSVLVSELKYFYAMTQRNKWCKPLPQLSYIFNYLNQDVLDPQQTFAEQLNAHLLDILTYREADLCESLSINEQIFVSTVHKAKGLEFENVILFDVVDDVYPSYFAKKSKNAQAQCQESARLLYVGMTRAKKRLTLAMYNTRTVLSKGKVYHFDQNPSPFLRSILKYFAMY